MDYVKYEKLHENARLPTQATSGSTGLDIYALEDVAMHIGDILAIRTGLKLDLSNLPKGADVQIRSRSGLSLNHGIVVLNSPGTIDRDYRGEVKVILMNYGDYIYQIRAGDKIAQLVIGMSIKLPWFPGEVSEDTDRGAGGFNSTGR